MSNEGITFVSQWIDSHVTQIVKHSVDGDAASLSVEMAEQLIADAEKATCKDIIPNHIGSGKSIFGVETFRR